MLSQYNLTFVPRTAIKTQALVDIVMECTFPKSPPEKDVQEAEEKVDHPESWKLFVEGSVTTE